LELVKARAVGAAGNGFDPKSRIDPHGLRVRFFNTTALKERRVATPPPTSGRSGFDETFSSTKSTIVNRIKSRTRNEFGLSTISRVMPSISSGGERNGDGWERSASPGRC